MAQSPSRPALSIRYVIVAALAAVAGFLLANLTWTEDRPHIINHEAASQFSHPRPMPAFDLIDMHGRAFTRSELGGAWTFVFFGYTFCPDICPTTLANFDFIAQTLRTANPAAEADTRFLFVSVDPDRDTPDRLQAYVTYFNPNFLAATGAVEQLDRFSRAAGAVYVKIPGDDPNNYLVDHSSGVFLFDPQARLSAVFTPPHDPDGVVRSYLAIRSAAS